MTKSWSRAAFTALMRSSSAVQMTLGQMGMTDTSKPISSKAGFRAMAGVTHFGGVVIARSEAERPETHVVFVALVVHKRTDQGDFFDGAAWRQGQQVAGRF